MRSGSSTAWCTTSGSSRITDICSGCAALIWATTVEGRTNHNKAACALANKLARICYATLRDATPYGQPAPRQQRKIGRTAFAVAV